MTRISASRSTRSLGQIAAALALTAIGTVAHAALPVFSFDPAAAGLIGTSFTANNLLISDFSTVTFDASGTTFTDTGFLSISAAQSASGATFTPGGLNDTYGMYIQFSGKGNVVAGGDPSLVDTKGSFTELNYTLYGYNGSASFGFTGNTPTTTAASPMVLATGTLISGSARTSAEGDGTFTPSGSARLNFAAVASGFYATPSTFYNVASTSFSNTFSQVEPFANGFRIRQGGGSINFATAVPEPGTYALLAADLGVVGFVARRKTRRPD